MCCHQDGPRSQLSVRHEFKGNRIQRVLTRENEDLNQEIPNPHHDEAVSGARFGLLLLAYPKIASFALVPGNTKDVFWVPSFYRHLCVIGETWRLLWFGSYDLARP